MAEETKNNTKGAMGRIVRIVGPVVDVEFPRDAMPAIYNALTVSGTTPIGEVHVVLEVQMHLPGDLVRAVAMSSTDGLVRGMEVQDTGNPIMMPVELNGDNALYDGAYADQSCAQIPAEIKNSISHRARAFEALVPHLQQALEHK